MAPRFLHAWVVVHVPTSHPSISASRPRKWRAWTLECRLHRGRGRSGEMHSDAMACEQSGHVAAENIQELAPFDAPSLEMLYPPPYFTVIADGNLRARLCIPARDRACVRTCRATRDFGSQFNEHVQIHSFSTTKRIRIY